MSPINSLERDGRVTHVDDASRVDIAFTLFATLICRSSEERQAFLSESEHSVKVQRQDFRPSLVLKIPSKFSRLQESSDVGRTG